MRTLLWDLHYALRQLHKAPGFALTAVLTLAIGIGGVTAVFSVVEAVLLRPLPFREPARLMSLHESAEQDSHELRMSAPSVLFFQRESKAFSSIGGYIGSSYELTGAGAPFKAQAERVEFVAFSLAGNRAYARAHLYPAGRRRCLTGNRDQLRAMERALPFRPPRARLKDRPRPPALHRHRSHAPKFRVSIGRGTVESARFVGADELHRRGKE